MDDRQVSCADFVYGKVGIWLDVVRRKYAPKQLFNGQISLQQSLQEPVPLLYKCQPSGKYRVIGASIQGKNPYLL